MRAAGSDGHLASVRSLCRLLADHKPRLLVPPPIRLRRPLLFPKPEFRTGLVGPTGSRSHRTGFIRTLDDPGPSTDTEIPDSAGFMAVWQQGQAIIIESAGEPEISASFDRESSATQLDRAMCGQTSAYVDLARHAVRSAGQRWRQSVAWRKRALTGRPGVRVQ